MRGGSWEDSYYNLRSAFRTSSSLDDRSSHTGFRCARDADGTAPSTDQSVSQTFDGVEMVNVPAGCFMMGTEDGNSDEQPVEEICLDEFWLDRTEVTNEQFEVFGGGAASAGYGLFPQQPRDSVTWYEARDYCALRGGRLPTEAEWEYAARGPDSHTYPWGDTFDPDNVVYNANANDRYATVGSRPNGVSWVGALDMAGNVQEWVSSIYTGYPYIADDWREDSDDTTSQRSLRGGSFWFDSASLRSSYRNPQNLDYTSTDIGVRCARDA
jgi:formylglycine-generating enzyme required for sulfatase activity